MDVVGMERLGLKLTYSSHAAATWNFLIKTSALCLVVRFVGVLHVVLSITVSYTLVKEAFNSREGGSTILKVSYTLVKEALCSPTRW